MKWSFLSPVLSICFWSLDFSALLDPVFSLPFEELRFLGFCDSRLDWFHIPLPFPCLSMLCVFFLRLSQTCYFSGFFPEATALLCTQCFTWETTLVFVSVDDLFLILRHISALACWIPSICAWNSTCPGLNPLLLKLFPLLYCPRRLLYPSNVSDYFLNLFPPLIPFCYSTSPLCQDSHSFLFSEKASFLHDKPE